MSRIGKLPIPIPTGVTVNIADRHVTAKGPKGALELTLHARVQAAVENNILQVSVKNPESQTDRALWGLTRVLISNMVTGVNQGFQKQLEINGVGFKAQVNGKNLVLNLGFSHPIEFAIPEGITMTVEKNVVTIAGVDKQLVGETAAKIRSLKKPEPYKGKGIKYTTETIRRKAGKVVKATGAK